MEVTRKRLRDDGGDGSSSETVPEIHSAAVKRLREDLLDSTDDYYDEVGTSNEDLYTFMKKFEDEITASPSAAAVGDVSVSDLTESSENLDYLLKASDDDLGIPAPPTSLPAVEGVLEAEPSVSEPDLFETGSSAFEEANGFGFGFLDNGDGEFAGIDLDGLIDYSDLGFGPGDFPLRPESLSAQ